MRTRTTTKRRKRRRRRRVEKRSGNALEGWRGTKWVETQDFRR